MQQCKIKIDFNAYQPFLTLEYDYELARNPDMKDDLIRFVNTFFKARESNYDDYYKMINECVISNNLIGLEILWNGIRRHDGRGSPCVFQSLEPAARYSDIKMFSHILWATIECLGGCTHGTYYFNPYKLKEIAKLNSHDEVYQFIEYIFKPYGEVDSKFEIMIVYDGLLDDFIADAKEDNDIEFIKEIDKNRQLLRRIEDYYARIETLKICNVLIPLIYIDSVLVNIPRELIYKIATFSV